MNNKIVLTGALGALAASFVGFGEYLLHYDALARFTDGGFEYMRGIAEDRTTVGHFLVVFGATLYPFGCYHLYLMLKPANQRLAFAAFVIGSLGFMVGADWMSSRASISALMQLPASSQIDQLVALYESRYEVLLWFVRASTLCLSAIFIYLSLSGKSSYPRWMALFNPILLLLLSFLIYFLVPVVGKHVMPIALNLGYFVFFTLSLCVCCIREGKIFN